MRPVPAAALSVAAIVSSTDVKNTHPKENVLGRVEAGGVDAGRVGSAALAHDAAGVAGNCALCRLASTAAFSCGAPALPAARCVRHHKVNHAFGGSADLTRPMRKRIIETTITISSFYRHHLVCLVTFPDVPDSRSGCETRRR